MKTVQWVGVFLFAVVSANASVEGTLTSKAPKDLFLKWKSSVSEVERNALKQAWGVRTAWTSQYVQGLERVVPEHPQAKAMNIVRGLTGHPSLQYAEQNYRAHRILNPLESSSIESLESVEPFSSMSSLPNDPMVSQQWAIVGDKGVHPEGAWDRTRGSRDVIAAVIDTGVDATHIELSDRVVAGYDFIDDTALVTDHHGHGTHVSGIIGARSGNGVGIAGINPEVTILAIRAVPSDGDETDQDVMSSFEFAASHGARVANCSFGKQESSQAVGDVIAGTEQAGLLAIVAAGNDGADLNNHAQYPAAFHTPNMIVVASHTIRGSLSFFSNYGLGRVDLSAPGSSILSTLPGNQYDSWDGTSMATPQVVGVAALVAAARPDFTPAQIKQTLLASVRVAEGLRTRVDTSGYVDATYSVASAMMQAR